MAHNILRNTYCKFNTQNILNKKYDFLHYVKGNFMGVFYPDKSDLNNIAVDVYVKAGNFNLAFFKEVMTYHHGVFCVLTVEKTNLPARWLANALGFNKKMSSDSFLCYCKHL